MNALIAVFLLLATTIASAQSVPAAAVAWQRTLVREAQSTIGVSAPVATLAAQLHQESGWRSDARSAVGAQGLAQFMPATAEWIAQVKPKRLSPVNPLDPRWSIMAQMEFMAFLLRRNPGATECDQWAFALSAYNGGEGWLRRDQRAAIAAGRDPLRWFSHVEATPDKRRAPQFVRENRDYPRRIMLRHAALYSRSGWGRAVACGSVS
jgi:soluble lytic murein transglycosylase-like protein